MLLEAKNPLDNEFCCTLCRQNVDFVTEPIKSISVTGVETGAGNVPNTLNPAGSNPTMKELQIAYITECLRWKDDSGAQAVELRKESNVPSGQNQSTVGISTRMARSPILGRHQCMYLLDCYAETSPRTHLQPWKGLSRACISRQQLHSCTSTAIVR